jgi:hypothetical protein
MVSQQVQTFCVLRFEVSSSDITVQLEFVHGLELMVAPSWKLAKLPHNNYEKKISGST